MFAASVFVDNVSIIYWKPIIQHFIGFKLLYWQKHSMYVAESVFTVLILLHNLCNSLWHAGYQLLGQILL